MNEIQQPNTEELMARVLAGAAEPGDAERLAALLRGDAGLRRRFGELAGIEGQLGVALEDDLRAERCHRKILAAVRQADRESFVAGVRGRLLRRRWLVRLAAAAAVLILASVLVLRRAEAPQTAAPVATMIRLETVDWGANPEISVGAAMKSGEHLRFEGGLAELEFGGRGRMIVEGPADLELAGPDRTVLRRGRVLMRVTPEGRGFRVETPEGSVIDLGTEFGVAVGENGDVETQVIEGKVEAVTGDGSRVMLGRDDALRLGPGGAERIEAASGAFYTRMPPRHRDAPHFIHWSFDEGRGQLARAEPGGLGSPDSGMVLKAMDAGRAPEWSAGVFRTALRFDGQGGYAESSFRGIGGGKPRTVCFWVKVPRDFSPRQGFGIVSWGRLEPGQPGTAWQISANPIASQGPVGRLRVGFHMGQAIGSTDLRDGRWHHVAVVLYDASNPEIGTHVMLYIDGNLEKLTSRSLPEIRTDTGAANHGVWVGRNISYVKSAPDPPQGAFFRGGIDELFIFDAALGRDEIRRLMETNR